MLPYKSFHFSDCQYHEDTGVVALTYAFEEGPVFVEKINFPAAPPVMPQRRGAVEEALRLLHAIAGVSYYKVAPGAGFVFDKAAPSAALADLVRAVYTEGLAEFAYRNGVDRAAVVPQIGQLTEGQDAPPAPSVGLPQASLVPLGGGKDSLVTVELLRQLAEPQTVTWVGRSPLIEVCAVQTGLPRLQITRDLSPILFDLNRRGALNGHVPITAINSAIMVLAALLYGFDKIVFSNERSASSPTLDDPRQGAVNHQWSKGFAFEMAFAAYVRQYVAADLQYFSLLRPVSELAITRQFARLTPYHPYFSSCNRNFKVSGESPPSRWCGQCPKCHFVFLALAPFMPKAALIEIFGRNLLDDPALAPDFDALLEWQVHKPFECVGEAQESAAAFYALSTHTDWANAALVRRFREVILPGIDPATLALAPLLRPDGSHHIPLTLEAALTPFNAG